MKRFLHAVGRTADGRTAVAGVYRFFETFGVPLDIIRDVLLQHGCVVAWDAFYVEATNAGIAHRKIMARMSDALPHEHVSLVAIHEEFGRTT